MRRIAVIGCGAIADSFHLPALKKIGRGDEIVLVDPDLDRARQLATRHGLKDVAESHRDVLDRVDAALIATPHHAHVPIALDLVDAGVATLSEKPLGSSVEEVERLRDAALAKGVTVAVNQTRRFIPACQEIRRLVGAGTLGSLTSVDIREGDKFDWPASTPSMFGARSRGRGVLLDVGAHVLDLMVWWFGPDLEVVEYLDDSFGGSEASALVVLQGDAYQIRVRLSWLAKQPNWYSLQGSDGRLGWGIYDLDRLTLEAGERQRSLKIKNAPKSLVDLGPLVLSDFFRSIDQRKAPMADPDSVLPSLRLIEACYEHRARFDVPGHDFEIEPSGG